MRKSILILLISTLAIGSLYGQSEYRYLAIRLGFSNAFSSQPDFNPNKYVYAPGDLSDDIQQMQITPVESFLGWTPGFRGSLLYHFDFTGDMAGVITGIDYNYTGLSSKYETLFRGFNMVETHRIHMVGVPIAFKYGPDIWDTQRYLYAGLQLNYIVSISTSEKVSWTTELGGSTLASEEYNQTTFSIFFGVNWKVVNFQFDFYPSAVFNDKFLVTNTTANEEFAKYEGQPSSFVKLTASINIPYGWLSENNFWWRRFLRKTKVGKVQLWK